MTEWIPAGLTPGTVGERVFASTEPAEAREAIGAAAEDDTRLAGALQAGAALTDIADPAAALASLDGVRAVGLFVALGEEKVAEGVDVILTAGHGQAGLGAARYVRDPDQGDRAETAWRRKTANGRWFTLDEAEPSFEQFGALGQASHLVPQVDDTAAVVGGAVAWSNLTGRPVRASGRIYNVRATIELTYGRLKGVGSTNSGAGAQATSLLLFSHLGAAPGIRTAPGGNKKLAVIEGFDLRAVSWDPTTGCAGYGLDIGSRVICRDLSVQHWGKSALFLHGDGVFGGQTTSGPYFSRFESCRFLYSREHGAVVGTGANCVTFVDCEWKWNGAPSYGVAPTAAGSWDGLYVNHVGEGNPENAYASYWTQNLTVIGGDASYNSRYGFHLISLRDSPNFAPGYAEFNKAADGFQAVLGLNVAYSHIAFGALSGGTASLKANGVYGEYAATNQILVGGKYMGGGGPYHPTGWLFGDVGLVYAKGPNDEVRSEGSTSGTGKHKVRLDGPNAEWNVGYNLSGGNGHLDEIAVSTVDGVKLPARGRAVKFLSYVPVANRGAVIAGSYTGDASAWLQAALDTGKDVDLEGVTIYAGGVSMSGNQKTLFSSSGPANIFKNKNGPILTVNGADCELREIVFRGVSVTHTGHNVSLLGSRPRMVMCGSLDAAGRAVYAPTDKVQILGHTYGYQTADTSATGYDIEIGNSSGATLYHQLQGLYGTANGGYLLVNTGSHTITGCMFGKLTLQKTGSFAGSNGGMTQHSRILGDVSVGMSNAVFASNQFSNQTITFQGGVGGCLLDESNLTGGVTIVNLGNGSSNYVARSIGTGAYPYNGPGLKVGSSTNPVELVFRDNEGVWSNHGYLTANSKPFRVRNAADTAWLNVLTMFQASDSVFVGHGSGPGNLALQAGQAGVRTWLRSADGTSLDAYHDFTRTKIGPIANNLIDLGTSALRFKDAFTHTYDALTEYRVNGTKVVGARETGWTAATGTALKGAWNADAVAGLTFSAAPTQAECDALRDACANAHKRVKAIENALRSHGLIG